MKDRNMWRKAGAMGQVAAEFPQLQVLAHLQAQLTCRTQGTFQMRQYMVGVLCCSAGSGSILIQHYFLHRSRIQNYYENN
jgi:hypothetical protein